MEWHEEAIARTHNRKKFDCGSAELNEYLQKYARQNHQSGGAKTFVAVPESGSTQVLGYYSISPAEVTFENVPPELTRKLGRYPVPVFRLARLAVDMPLQGQGLGGELLLSAGKRAVDVAVLAGGVALVIDAKDSQAASWYQRFGAVELLDDPLRLFLPLETVSRALEAGAQAHGR